MKQGELVQAVMKGVPYPQHVNDLDLESESNAIRFEWRGDRFRVSESGMVEQHKNGCLCGSNIAILMEQCVKIGMVNTVMTKSTDNTGMSKF